MGAAAVAALAFAASPASAGDVYAEAVGSQGWGDFSYNSRTSAYSIILTVQDTKADGHHVRVRAQSQDPLGNISSYSWRYNYEGYGAKISWSTSLTDSDGIRAMRVQVCTYEGDTPLSCDTSGWDGNPYY
ncbi:hypothetical protein [Streptomyces sp. PSKA30]|uniref:hypothetical protein n=1 Tax=Streptomyces sp. PSKA30 TaxID=2874597 RepID=UPI001CD0B1FD|nr:hypothetical protein [Streptomyces sp. PSKA30]MBZ9640081.1 hypothetical protein [Streptomyces sp. PSKA30]